MPLVGILALQGGYAAHARCLDNLQLRWRYVRQPAELRGCDALILPGGESTTQTRLLHSHALAEPLHQFAALHPLFGSCAGLVLMSAPGSSQLFSLGVLDIRIARNAYGRQQHSFVASVACPAYAIETLRAPFIRAPRICAVGPEVQTLAYWQQDPILVAQGWHLGMSFHPELAMDGRLHSTWLKQAFGLSRLKQPATVGKHG